YVDATLGGGGHSLAMLIAEPSIRLFGFDQDLDAIEHAGDTLKQHQNNVEYIHANFQSFRSELALRRIKSIDGILFDLGVSSRQLDDTGRGFSFDHDADLDMRMNREQEISAYEVVNNLSVREISNILWTYGEEQQGGRIARAIESQRAVKEIKTTLELARIIESVAGKGSKESLKTKVRVFQGIRIYVNREMDVLEPALTDAINLLAPGGRIVVLSYHSLEDRIVKNVFREAAKACICPPQALKCICTHKRSLKVLTKNPLIADENELTINNRSRSAKLRAAEKIMGES
ncbi:MAG: 16S rRNA (cytosine(1402)-N(4))-methyltransferase RsmH, partial [Candidatus Cloacimonadaceae bacterium]|nr:16S rRNA (cytosine(1402)-N(4))-methyltransferase RsmH [Candidatus Cloacimonadaceae bacterium]